MERITKKDLEYLVDRLNDVTGSPPEPHARNDAGQLVANIGNYHLSYAYGGASLHRTVNEGGGVSDVLSYGHVPKRDLYDRLHAYLRGYEQAQTEARHEK